MSRSKTPSRVSRDLDGKHDEIPEQAFYMLGGIDMVLEKYEQMKAEG